VKTVWSACKTIYKAADGIVAAQLRPLFDQIWTEKNIPKEWKVSILLPFFKKGDKLECKNCRGITLTDIAESVLPFFSSIDLNRPEKR
jgi:hypothetical protein